MYAARVVGTVVCTSKEEKLTGLKMLVVQPVNVLNMKNDGKCAVAIDAVGAGHNEIVLVVGGQLRPSDRGHDEQAGRRDDYGDCRLY